MKGWLIDIAVGAIGGYLALAVTIGWLLRGSDWLGPVCAAGALGGVVLMRMRRARAAEPQPAP